jgi:hypothetical protein
MKFNVLKKQIFFIAMILISYCTPNEAYDDSGRCFKEIENDFFRQSTVFQALSLHNVFQSQWTPIMNDLRSRAREVPTLVAREAANSSPNPLSPYDRIEAWNLLNRVLYRVFAQSLLSNRQLIFNEVDVKQMYAYIVSTQKARLIDCFGEEIFQKRPEENNPQENDRS